MQLPSLQYPNSLGRFKNGLLTWLSKKEKHISAQQNLLKVPPTWDLRPESMALTESVGFGGCGAFGGSGRLGGGSQVLASDIVALLSPWRQAKL